MFNFLKKSREFNLPEQALPYRLEELCDLFTRVYQDKRYTIVSKGTLHDMMSHINTMYTNVPLMAIADTPEALAIRLNDMRGVLHNRYSGVTTIDEAISILTNTNDLADDVPYPIFETMIDNLIRHNHSNSVLSHDLNMLKLSVKNSHYSHRQLYGITNPVHWSNTTGCTTNDIINRLRKIQQENSNMHVTFDDAINSVARKLTLTGEQNTDIYIGYAQSCIYHLIETYKNDVKVTQYLDQVDSKLTSQSMKNEITLPVKTFLAYIHIAKTMYNDNKDNTHTTVSGEFYAYDHIPTVKELNQQQATKNAQWVLEAKDELLKWFNQVVVHNASTAENKAVLDSYHYPKAYDLLTIQPEYLTDKGYRLNSSLSSVSRDKDYIGSAFVDVPAFTVTWDRDTKLIKAILY